MLDGLLKIFRPKAADPAKSGTSEPKRGDNKNQIREAAALRAREGRFPQAVNMASNEVRRYKFTARLLAVLALGELGIILILASTILMMLPLRQVEPYLIQFSDKSEQVVRIEPIARTMTARAVISEMQARQYVTMRHAITRDTAELRRRWDLNGYMGTHNDRKEFDRFRIDISRSLDQILQNGVTREVIINRSSITGEFNAQIEFTVIDRDSNEREFSRQLLVADITFAYRPRQTKFDERFINPTGFTVTYYQLSLKTQ